MTVAMSLLVHGEAVRFNRGQSSGDDFDFKYMKGRDRSIFPYISSQCYKKYWRESLASPLSPIIREKDASGKAKNQAFTSGNPIAYVDDDLFGYMIAGASEAEAETGDTEVPAEAPRVFEADNLKNAQALAERLLDGSAASKFIIDDNPGVSEKLQNPASPEDLGETLLDLLENAAKKSDLPGIEGIKSKKLKSKPKGQEEVRKFNRALLLATFSKELRETPKRPTTRRTAPVRMHAVVAFSGIKTAKDFQTFSRDIAYTGLDSVLNPKPPGIYSAWLKTRILIESRRIGRFYIGENMDILPDQANNQEILQEPNPYAPGEHVQYVLLDEAERTNRLRAVIRALADMGNRQGPASGALHDGSLRPKAFVAGLMKCVDSPFDYIWTARNDDQVPNLDIDLLCNSIRDWDDLFAVKKIYIGLPVNTGARARAAAATGDSAAAAEHPPASEVQEIIKTELDKIGFAAIIDTPRKALLQLAAEATP